MSYLALALESLEAKLSNKFDSTWLDDPRRMELLRQHMPYKSGSQVADIINAETGSTFTRSACIAKARSAGIPRMAPTAPRKPQDVPKTKRARKARPATNKRLRRSPMAIGLSGIEVDRPFEDEPLKMQPKSIFDLENRHCRFPIGDPKDPGFFYCGADGADLDGRRPYCTFHAKIAFGRWA